MRFVVQVTYFPIKSYRNFQNFISFFTLAYVLLDEFLFAEDNFLPPLTRKTNKTRNLQFTASVLLKCLYHEYAQYKNLLKEFRQGINYALIKQ